MESEKRRIYTILFRVCVFSLIGFIALWFYAKPRIDTIEYEFATSFLQIGMALGIGGLISVLTFQYQEISAKEETQKNIERETRQRNLEYRDELLKEILHSALENYNTVKKARRLLRARAITQINSSKIVLATPYDTNMDLINDAQLEFESLAKDVEISATAFKDHETIHKQLCAIETYLHALVKEYETSRTNFQGNPASLELAQLQCLTKFLDKTRKDDSSENGNFGKGMANPMKTIRECIRKDLQNPQLSAHA
jgi:hypothetical protein